MTSSLNQFVLRLILLVAFFSLNELKAENLIVLSQDTINPVFTTIPQGQSVNCENNTSSSLETWYNSRGGAVATDNSGEVSIESLVNLTELQDSLNRGPSNCFQYDVGFYAIDTCQNSSDTVFVEFSTFDQQNPVILIDATNFVRDCADNVNVLLQGWFDSSGGAIVRDNCAEEPTWTRFVWVDSNNSVGEGVPNEGPYAQVDTTVCDWNVRVTFVVEDNCGNAAQTTATFSVEDLREPIFIDPPQNITISCITDLPVDTINYEDNCTRDVGIEFRENNTRSTDSLSCEFFNFTVVRTWVASDNCGLQSTHTQTISVIDTLVPEFMEPADITVFCGDELNTSITGEPVDISNNCNERAIISFSDTPVRDSCSYLINRFWEVRDVCGSSNTFPQSITVIDTSGPEVVSPVENRTVNCSADVDLASSFSQWLSSGGSATVQDACGGVSFFAARRGTYNINDPSTFPGALPVFVDTIICSLANPGILNSIPVDFVFYDSCGNATVSAAEFQVVDMIAPVFSDVLSNQEFTADGENCGATVSIGLPLFSDNCTRTEDVDVIINLDGNPIFENDTTFENIDTLLEVGTHVIQYVLTDCSGNRKVEIINVVVSDTIDLSGTCPEDLTVYLGAEECSSNVLLPINYSLVDNCLAGIPQSETLPSTDEEALLLFGFNGDFDEFGAQSKSFTFTNFSANAIESDPVLTIRLWADIDESGEFFTITGDDGSSLGTIGERVGDSCNKEIVTQFSIPINLFNTWAADGSITITATPNTPTNNVEFISPCDEMMVTADGDNDGVSSIFANITYEAIGASYFAYGATTLATKVFPSPDFIPTDTFSLGESQVSYIFMDGSGSIDTCSFMVSILDTIKPTIVCQSDTLFIHPSGLIFESLTDQNVLSQMDDNCAISGIDYSAMEFSCDDIDSTFSIIITASDESGNQSQCTAEITILGLPIFPSFEAGFCIGDTLKLFANIPESPDTTNYTFEWTGPNDFTSNEENPIIESTEETNSGIYNLTVTGRNGCISFASIDVQLDGLSTPTISSSSNSICKGDTIILNTDNAVAGAQYEWYNTSIADTTILIAATDTSTLDILPSDSLNQIFVVIKTDQCESNPSDTLMINVLDSLVINLVNDNISVCIGDSINFEISDPQGFDYIWSGPNNYISSGAMPATILDATSEDSGIYRVVATQGGCTSDTIAVNVSVSDGLPLPVIEGDNVYCFNSDLRLTADTLDLAAEYTWYLNDSLVQVTNADTLNIDNIDSTYAGNWYVIASDVACLSDTSAIFAVSVLEEFQIEASSNAPICSGDTLRLMSTLIEDANYNWIGPNGFMSNVQNPIFAGGSTGDYRVLIVNDQGCQAIDTVEVVINTLPVISDIEINSGNCIDGSGDLVLSPMLSDTLDYSYSWSGPNGFISTDTIVTIQNVTSAENGEYKLVISNGVCASDTFSLDVNLTAVPQAPQLLGNEVLCLMDTLQLNVDVFEQEFDSLVWNTPEGSFKTVGNSFRITRVDIDNEGEYSVSLFINGCESPLSNIIDLDIVDEPEAPSVSIGGGVICLGADLQLSADSISGAIYEWRGPNGYAAVGREQLITNVTLSDQGGYGVRIKINDCESPYSPDFFVSVLSPPQTPTAFANNSNICASQAGSVTLCINSESVTAGANYQWTNSTNGDFLGEGISSCLIVTDMSLFDNGLNNILVNATVSDCVSDDSPFVAINVDRIPDGLVAIAGDDLLVCGDTQVDISANMPDNTSGFWTSVTNVPNFQNTNANETNVTNLQDGDNILVWNLRYATCNVFSTDTISVFVEQPASLSNDNATGSFNQTLTVNVFENDVLPEEYEVSIIESPDGTSTDIDADGNLTLSPGNNFLGTAEIVYEVCNIECSSLCETAILTVEIGGDLECFTPSLITPNGDNINDAFVVPCLATGDFPQNQILIFNEWGDEVFSAAPYKNDWEGTYDGELLPAGTYFYILDLGNGERPFRGFLLIEQ